MTRRGKGRGGKRKSPGATNHFHPERSRSSSSSPHRGPHGGDKHRGKARSKDNGPRVSEGQKLQILASAQTETAKALARWRDDAEDLLQRRQKPSDGVIHLDPWQEEAVQALHEGAHVIVDAPTTAGKTRVVEAFFRANLARPDFRAAYTTPVKSLSNDKLREFREMFGAENVGIATGDIKENLDAPIVVATLESYRNSLLGVEPDLGRSLVVFDEYHYLQDMGRGSAWEEAIILTPPNCQLLLLSASVANATEFAAWIEKITPRPCRLVSTLERPVPLVDIVYHEGHWLLKESLGDLRKRPLNEDLLRQPIAPDKLALRVKGLVELGLTPCIVYVGRRLACETLATMIARHLPPLSPSESDVIRRKLGLDREKDDGFIKGPLKKLLLHYGVGYHHSGLAPHSRVAIESLVKDGALRFCVATMGLSVGINFSVRSALIADYRRPGEMGFTQYAPSEVLQMLGRAGRRGRDAVGFSLWPTLESYRKLGGAVRQPIESNLRNDPTTFLGLVGRGMKTRDIENFYEKSFMRFRDKKVDLSLVRRDVLKDVLHANDLPCRSPAHAYAAFIQEEPDNLCQSCPLRPRCHAYLEKKMRGALSFLHVHLHQLSCIDDSERLTSFGSIARYFPQAGGLLIARMIHHGEIGPSNLLDAAQLMAILSHSRFKEPNIPPNYHPPFDLADIEASLEDIYPYELFPEVYDPPFGRREYPVFRDFNPAAGYLVKEWVLGASWDSLVRQVTHEQYGQGDLMGVFYRTATYLQSMSQAGLGELSSMARSLRETLLREPLSPAGLLG